MTESHAPKDAARPVLHRAADNSQTATAVTLLLERLQSGLTNNDADQYDSLFASDLLWGSPKGQVLQGYSRLNTIHRSMMDGTVAGAPTSEFQEVQTISPASGVVVTQIRRQSLTADGEPDAAGFSEMAMYVLVKKDDQWWLAAGQNTPVSDVLPTR